MVKPASAVFVGLGAEGIKTLNEIAHMARQAYGNEMQESFALLGFDFNVYNVDPHVRQYAVPQDIKDWLTNKSLLDRQHSLWNWFDARYYGSTQNADKFKWQNERQLVRLAFIKHLQEQGGQLEQFLKTHLNPVWINKSHPNRSVMTYVIGSLDDVFTSALLLDVINHVYRMILSLKRETTLIVHLALPKAFQDLPTEEKARVYAVMRELERFMLSYGDMTHVIYPLDSGLEGYNANSSLLIYSLKIYAPQPETNLAELWADILLPQLDSGHHFGVHYQQFNVANWNGYRDAQMATSRIKRGLYAGTYLTRTVLFPLERLRIHWTGRLSLQILEEWIGEPRPLLFNEWVNNQWLDYVFTDPSGNAISCPPVVRWLLSIDSANTLLTLSSGALHEKFYRSETHNAAITAIQSEYHKALAWNPVFEKQANLSVPEFIHSVRVSLEETIGKLDLSEYHTPYTKSLAQIEGMLYDRFQDSLIWFIKTLLDSHGVANAYTVVNEFLTPRLKTAVQRLQNAVNESRKAFLREDFLSRLETTARRITKLKTLFGKPTPEAEYYFRLIEQTAEQLQRYLLLKSLHSLAQSFCESLLEMRTPLADWVTTLYKAPDALLMAIRAASTPLNLNNTETRLWLLSPQWEAETYDKLYNELGQSLRNALQWEISAEGLRLMLGPTRQELLTDSNTGVRQRNTNDWQTLVRSAVYDTTIDLWHGYLASQELYRTLLPELSTFLTQPPPTNWHSRAFLEEDFLILPATAQDAVEMFVMPLQERFLNANIKLKETFQSEDLTRITRYSTAEVFAVFDMPFYWQAKAAYQQLDRAKRSRCHVLPAEIEAVKWESRSKDLLKNTGRQEIILSSNVVVLLAHMDRVQQFIRLEALSLIRVIEFQDIYSRYALVYSDQVWWIGGQTERTYMSRLTAITAFVFTRGPVQFGYPPQSGMRQLPHDILDAVIKSELQECVERRGQFNIPYNPASDLSHLLSISGDGYLDAEEADALLFYLDHLVSDLDDQNPGDERDLTLLLALLAKDLYEKKIKNLQERIV